MAPEGPVSLRGQRLSWVELCSTVLHKPVRSVASKSIARLWSGYGSIHELAAMTEDGQTHRLIAKQVDPPQQRGESHERKLKSYAVEAAFYAHHAQRLLADQQGAAAIAAPLLVDVSPPTHFLFVLTDLRTAYPSSKYSLDKEDAAVALDWLAAFHALWWEEAPGQGCPVSTGTPFTIAAGGSSHCAAAGAHQPGVDGPGSIEDGLWDQGSYFHLDTRQQEFQAIPRSWTELKGAAGRLDSVLKGLRRDGTKTARHRTLLHGDAKCANLLWAQDGRRCAAYDFQYCGEGLGVVDVAYLLASSVDAEALEEAGGHGDGGDDGEQGSGGERALLRHYHAALTRELARHGKAAAAAALPWEVLWAQYEVALADYVRFMAGWGMWGNAEWASTRAREVLRRLDDVIDTARTGW